MTQNLAAKQLGAAACEKEMLAAGTFRQHLNCTESRSGNVSISPAVSGLEQNGEKVLSRQAWGWVMVGGAAAQCLAVQGAGNKRLQAPMGGRTGGPWRGTGC